MTVYALINKEVLPFICQKLGVTIEYLYSKTRFKLDKLQKWLDVFDVELPTVVQAKKIAKCLHIPFAGLYMNTKDIKIKIIPSVKNYRTIDGKLFIDDSSLNIAICDVLQERDFWIEESKKLDIKVPVFSSPSFSTENPIDLANTIREYFEIDWISV